MLYVGFDRHIENDPTGFPLLNINRNATIDEFRNKFEEHVIQSSRFVQGLLTLEEFVLRIP